MAGNLAIRFDLGVLLNLDKHTYLGMVANFATICRTQRIFTTPALFGATGVPKARGG
jgi:hypothetical protein